MENPETQPISPTNPQELPSEEKTEATSQEKPLTSPTLPQENEHTKETVSESPPTIDQEDLTQEKKTAIEEKTETLPAQWYALHVLSGHEGKVRRNIELRVKIDEVSDLIQEIIIPVERVSEIKKDRKLETERKLYPGYIFVKMRLYDEDKKIVEKAWYFIRETKGILGYADGGERPHPMREAEIDAMLNQMKEKEGKVIPKIAYSVGDKVKVEDGPFLSQEGIIEEIDAEKGKLSVSVSMFGRSTPVELEYWQVSKTV